MVEHKEERKEGRRKKAVDDERLNKLKEERIDEAEEQYRNELINSITRESCGMQWSIEERDSLCQI